MNEPLEPIKQSVKSGQYFANAKDWYYSKYLYPVTERSFLLFLLLILLALVVSLFFSMVRGLPLKKQVIYLLPTENIYDSSASINKAVQIENKPLESIADIMVRNYVINRESYDYDKLKQQFTFVKNNSTRVVFGKFYNFMDIDNPISPMLRYQKSITRSINIVSVNYHEHGKAVIIFESLATDKSKKVFKKILWKAEIEFEIDPIDLKLPANSRFNFVVTDYQLKLLENKNDNKKQ